MQVRGFYGCGLYETRAWTTSWPPTEQQVNVGLFPSWQVEYAHIFRSLYIMGCGSCPQVQKRGPIAPRNTQGVLPESPRSPPSPDAPKTRHGPAPVSGREGPCRVLLSKYVLRGRPPLGAMVDGDRVSGPGPSHAVVHRDGVPRGERITVVTPVTWRRP